MISGKALHKNLYCQSQFEIELTFSMLLTEHLITRTYCKVSNFDEVFHSMACISLV
jgi:hypothetical protein